MIEALTLGAALATLLVSVFSLVLLRRSLHEVSCQYGWCWRRVASVQEHNVAAEAVPAWASGASVRVPLCRKHETEFDNSEIEQDFKDRFTARDNPQ